jgi:glucose/arabinose dehydrogenase
MRGRLVEERGREWLGWECHGALMDIIGSVITGLPVAYHDHGVDGLEFGDEGELYIMMGSNPNGGIPGQLSATARNSFIGGYSGCMFSDSTFDGFLSYDADDDGNLDGGCGVEVCAAGFRNPLGIKLAHSNGYLHGTDNGPNRG